MIILHLSKKNIFCLNIAVSSKYESNVYRERLHPGQNNGEAPKDSYRVTTKVPLKYTTELYPLIEQRVSALSCPKFCLEA